MINEFIANWLNLIITTFFFVVLYLVVKILMSRQSKGKTDFSIIKSITLFTIALIGIVAIVLAIPMSSDTKGQITSLIGIVLSAVFALSSATFIGNGLAGIMMRAINNFKPGDFISVGDHFGRISERGLFHTEIQTENRDLTTLPNLFLATNPVKVTRASGSFVSSEVSLGYDVSRITVESKLLEAAKSAGLTDPFVHITGLGDFSVVYKVHGLLSDVRTLLTAKSKLNAMVLDHLHNAGIEIMSPTFVGQRQVNEIEFIPQKARHTELKQLEKDVKASRKAEELIFDKAEEAESIERRKENVENIDKKIAVLQTEIQECETDEGKERLKEKIANLKLVKDKIQTKIVEKAEEISQKE